MYDDDEDDRYNGEFVVTGIPIFKLNAGRSQTYSDMIDAIPADDIMELTDGLELQEDENPSLVDWRESLKRVLPKVCRERDDTMDMHLPGAAFALWIAGGMVGNDGLSPSPAFDEISVLTKLPDQIWRTFEEWGRQDFEHSRKIDDAVDASRYLNESEENDGIE